MIKYLKNGTNYNFPEKRKTSRWLLKVVENETNNSKFVDNIAFIFSSDEQILEINSKYLNHNYLTDVITFNYNEGNFISADVFIGVNTVKENSIEYRVNFLDEMRRVIVHSVLHLLGYNDSNQIETSLMREKEDYYLFRFFEYSDISE